MLVKDVVQKTTGFFKEKGFATARLDTELLISKAMNWDRVRLYMNFDYPLSEKELEACRALVRRRSQGEPVAYILGTKDFYKSTFAVRSGVLIPRPETELLVESVFETLRKGGRADDQLLLVDLGSGSGCIGLSLLTEFPNARLVAVDLSETAVELTRENAERLGVADRAFVLHKSVDELEQADLAVAGLGERADLVVANPPYIAPDDPQVMPEVRAFEPAEALFSGQDGYAHIATWSRRAAALAKPGAVVMFEIGAGQGAGAKRIFEETGAFSRVNIEKDLSSQDRFIKCVFEGENQNG